MKPQKVPSPPFLPGTRPCVLSQQHLGRCIRIQSVDGCWLSPALALMSGSWSPFPPTWWEGVWSIAGIPRGFLSGALPSPSLVPQPLPSWKSLLLFSHLSVLSPLLGCAAINNSQGPPPLLPTALTEERAVVGVAPCWSVRDRGGFPQWGPSPCPVTRPQGRAWGGERPGPP